MKRIKILIVICCFAMLTACNPAPTNSKGQITEYITKKIGKCEYIEVSANVGTNVGLYSLTHRGDCENPIHVCSTPTVLK